ncbi:MAG: sugar phosphate nucleotidyltransferase [Planctomycetota bacterium]
MRPVKVLTMILAGGVGERLYPLTAQRSKPAVPFGGNFRIIDFTIMNCVLSGLRNIHLLTQYHSLSLAAHRSERWSFLSSELGEFIEVVPPKMRTATGFYHGTADAIYRNLDILDRHRPDLVLCLSGDHVYRADYQKFIEAHLQNDADITVLSDWCESEAASSFGVIEAKDGRIESFVEKPADPTPYATDGRCQINLGVYCFGTKFLVQQLIADSKRRTAHDFGKNILPDSLDKGNVISCPLELICPDPVPYWRDVGTIDSYYRANMDTLESPATFELGDSRWPDGSRFHEWLPSRFPGARIEGQESGRNLISSGCDVALAHVDRSVLSPGVKIGQDSEIDGCILFPGVKIGRNVRLRRVVVEEGVNIPDGTVIGYGDDSRHFTQSPGGVIVIAAGYRFDEPAPLELVTEETNEKPKKKHANRVRKATREALKDTALQES